MTISEDARFIPGESKLSIYRNQGVEDSLYVSCSDKTWLKQNHAIPAC